MCESESVLEKMCEECVRVKLKHRDAESRCRARACITALAEQEVAAQSAEPTPDIGSEQVACCAKLKYRGAVQVHQSAQHALGEQQVARLPCRGAEPRCRAERTLERSKSRACHWKLTHRGAESMPSKP